MENIRAEEEGYLAFTIHKIQEKLKLLSQKMGENTRDLESMNDYFWDNYAEFDEYGYEMYDNKMALKSGLSQQELYARDMGRYEKMLDSPYFGRVDFCYDGETEPEVYYIGLTNLAEHAKGESWVYDWRAPVSSLFYDYDRGAASFEAPMGHITGEIARKRQYKIRNGRLVFALETDMNIDDEILQQTLAETADAKLKNIVTTIQKEQNGIIRDMCHRIMVVQGCAGSGKTSVALHRIAYLLYHNRESLKAAQVLVLSPNSIFADYISRILPELGEENVCEMTLDDYAYRELREFGEAEDKYDELERMLHGERGREASYKQSREFVRELDGFLLRQEWELVNITDFRLRKMYMSSQQISRLFYEKLCDTPILGRMRKIAEYVIDEEETLRGRDMEEEEREEVYAAFEQMYRSTSAMELYQEFLMETGRENQLTEGTVISYKDVYPLMYLKYSLNEIPRRRQVKHLVIDEMQDYTYLQFCIISKMFDCPMTMLGDRMQTMEETQRDVMEFLPEIFGKKLFYVQMNRSYRSTREIMAFAGQVALGQGEIAGAQNEAAECVNRHGEAPEVESCGTREDMFRKIAEHLNQENDYRTRAVICLDQEAAREAYEELLRRKVSTVLLIKDSVKFETGICVLPFYLAKGLEFDEVLIPDLQRYHTSLHQQALYIEVTRALHALRLYRTEPV